MLPMWGHKKYWLERPPAATSKTLAVAFPQLPERYSCLLLTPGVPPGVVAFVAAKLTTVYSPVLKTRPLEATRAPLFCLQPEQLWRTLSQLQSSLRSAETLVSAASQASYSFCPIPPPLPSEASTWRASRGKTGTSESRVPATRPYSTTLDIHLPKKLSLRSDQFSRNTRGQRNT